METTAVKGEHSLLNKLYSQLCNAGLKEDSSWNKSVIKKGGLRQVIVYGDGELCIYNHVVEFKYTELTPDNYAETLETIINRYKK